MTGPQLEDGHIRIANELFDAILRFGFSKRQLTVLLAVVRKTYGYGKKVDDMTVQQLANVTSLPRQHVSTTLGELVALRAVLKRDGQHGYILGINKNYGEWRTAASGTETVPKQDASQNRTETVPKQDDQRPKTGHTKDNPKRQPQKVEGKPSVPHSEILAVYHETLPELPRVQLLNPGRRQAIAARWHNELPTLEDWRAYFGQVKEQPFLLGDNDRNWRPGFDWLLKPANVAKVLEGNYRRCNGQPAQSHFEDAL